MLILYKFLAALDYFGVVAVFILAIVASIFISRRAYSKNSLSLASSPKISEEDSPKKFFGVDIHRHSWMFMGLGMLLSLLFCWSMINMPTFEKLFIALPPTMTVDMEEAIEIPPPTQQLPPPPPVIQAPTIVEVPDEKKIDKIEIEIEVEPEKEITIVPQHFDPNSKAAPVQVEEEKIDEVFEVVEEQAQPEGGMAAFYEYLKSNIKYPKTAKRMGIEGKVFVRFVVERDGSVTDVQVVKGIDADGGECNKEAIRVILATPKWKPGKQRGKPVRSRMMVPISFKLGS
jgi:protein TonB